MIRVNYFLRRCGTLYGRSCHAVLSVFRCEKESRHDFSISTIKEKKAETNAGQKVDLSKFPPDKIRNFSIVAHVDHGKSTLADRMLEITGTISATAKNKQVLDKLQVERERGITVKAQTASIVFKHKGEEYLLNLIDTPGHVDFSYEVSRSLGACQGVVLLVDATQGVQAQTLSNFYLTMEKDLKVIPVINKIDLKSANVKGVSSEMERFLDIPQEDIISISAKTGFNVSLILEAIVDRLPSPSEHFDDCDSGQPLRALLFDSSYESYRGVNANIALSCGSIKTGDRITSSVLSSSKSLKGSYEVKEVGILRPDFYPTEVLYAGQVGYMFCGMKSTSEARIGDTVYHVGSPVEPFPGFTPAKPMVFGTLFPAQQSDFTSLKKALEKLTLNDSSVTVQSASTAALGAGFRLGFLGLLHMDVFQQRLEQEYDEIVICTAPTVPYKAVLSSESAIKLHGSKEITIKSPADFPELNQIEKYMQPMEKDGIEINTTYIDNNRAIYEYKLPLNEIIVDFNDKLKTITSGFGSFDYEDAGYEEANLVRVDILINDVLVPELSAVFNDIKAVRMGRHMCSKLKDAIPKQLFVIIIRATIGKKIIARETINALRKDVVAKCYGGDITRRMKLLKNQKEGKKRMRKIGKVEVPKEAFIKVLQE